MPYIFHSNNRFTLIDSSIKNGVFCQIFSSSYMPKLIPIYPQNTVSYSAHMDVNGKLYVAVMPDDSHLHYYVLEGNRFKRYTLVSNTHSNYQLASPIIYTMQNIPYIIYLSHQSNTDTYDFVQENLFQPNLSTLMTCYLEPMFIKSYVTPSRTFVFFVTYDDAYHLNAFQIYDGHISSDTYLTTPHPISDYSVCIEDNILHIAYVSELHGKYQLSYFNTQTNEITILATTQYVCRPTIFCYCNMIWINVILNAKLQILISIDNGQSFSLPAPCSLQNNIHRCHFLTHKSCNFIGQEVYASINNTLKICTLAMIDLPKLHPDTHISPELELLLEGLMLSIDSAHAQSSSSSPATTSSIQNQPQETRPVSSDTEPKAEVPSSNPSIDDAKNAFMNELPGWELPPLV